MVEFHVHGSILITISMTVLAVICSIVDAVDLSTRQVLVAEDLCDQIIDMGTDEGNWTRVLFPYNQTCSGQFDCRLTFHTRIIANVEERDLCVDLSRLRLYGDGTMLHVGDGDHVHHKLTKHHNSTENSVFCSTADQLTLHFKAKCHTPLSSSFLRWMYVYTQGPQTGTIYFVDGSCSHLHQMEENSKVTLLSYLWPREPNTLFYEQCQLRLQQSNESDPANVSVQWNNSVGAVIPPGVTIRISGADVDQSLWTHEEPKAYLTLEGGDRLSDELNEVYPLSFDKELTFKVTRSLLAQNATAAQATLLFELEANGSPELNKTEEEDVEEDQSKPTWLKITSTLVSVANLVLSIVVLYQQRHFWKRFCARSSCHADQGGENRQGGTEHHEMLPSAYLPTSSVDGQEQQGEAPAEDSFCVPVEPSPPLYSDPFPDRWETRYSVW